MTQGQIIDPQKLPLDSQGLRYRPPAGAAFVRVRARQACTAAGRYREPGDVFDYPLADGEELPTWADRVADGTELERESNARAVPRDDSLPLMSHLVPDQPGDAGDTFSGAAHAHRNVL